MCVCVCVCVFVCVCVSESNIRTYIHVCMYTTYIRKGMYVHVYFVPVNPCFINVYICTYVRIYTHTYIHMCVIFVFCFYSVTSLSKVADEPRSAGAEAEEDADEPGALLEPLGGRMKCR
jgi:hypothetical protein